MFAATASPLMRKAGVRHQRGMRRYSGKRTARQIPADLLGDGYRVTKQFHLLGIKTLSHQRVFPEKEQLSDTPIARGDVGRATVRSEYLLGWLLVRLDVQRSDVDSAVLYAA